MRSRAAEPIPMPTLGGQQFWADELFFHQWHIQRNTVTGHCRLLDGKNFRHKSGSYQECVDSLEAIKERKKLPSMSGKAVIVLHGLDHSHWTMEKIADFLRDKGGYEVFNVTYPSSQREIGDHARKLKHIIEHLDGIEEINFVAHSLGNIVIRHYLGDETDPATGRRPDPRIKRFVMLGPPNHQSHLADFAGNNAVFQLATGQAGQQLGRDWKQLEPKLATPAFEFGILAGGKNDGRGYNPILVGDDDGIVTVEHTRLVGATDFLVLPVLHTFMMNDAKVQECTLRFLREGCFVAPDKRQPITK